MHHILAPLVSPEIVALDLLADCLKADENADFEVEIGRFALTNGFFAPKNGSFAPKNANCYVTFADFRPGSAKKHLNIAVIALRNAVCQSKMRLTID